MKTEKENFVSEGLNGLRKMLPVFIIAGSLLAYSCLMNVGSVSADGGATSSISLERLGLQQGGTLGLETQGLDEIFEIFKIIENERVRFIAIRDYPQLGGTTGLEHLSSNQIFKITKIVENNQVSYLPPELIE